MKKIVSFCLALCATTVLWAGTSNFTPAAFSIADGKQIYFSQGNLQCSGTSSFEYVWSFSENQYDMLGTANVSGDALADKIDLFGWSTTGIATWGISTFQNNDYYSGDFVDWGTNAINANEANTYRTPTKDEWKYLLETRTDAEEKRGIARINISSDGIEFANGLILLPDSWTAPADVEFKSGLASEYSIDAYAEHQIFTLAQWQKLEAAGAIFLPASGGRDGANVYNVQANSYYWSATPNDSEEAYELYGFSSGLNPVYNEKRHFGFAVRLVRDVHVNIAAVTNGTVEVDNLGAAEGETVTLTITPAEGYEVESVTVTYGDGQTVEVKDNKFIMPAGDVTITVVFKVSGTAIGTVEMLDLRTENGSIIYDGEFQIFDLLGRNVTRLNGSLNGVYIVKVGDKAQKVIVSRK